MKIYIIGFFVVCISTLILDSIWLHLTLKTFYEKHLNGILEMKANISPALIFYILYTIALLFFVIFPLINSQAHMMRVFFTGAFFGLIAYATYDLTNQATIKNWPTIVTVVDMIWGSVLTGSVTTISIILLRFLRLM